MITVIVIIVGVPNGPGKGEEGQWYFPPHISCLTLTVGGWCCSPHFSGEQTEVQREEKVSHTIGWGQNQPSKRDFCQVPKPTVFSP